MENEQVNTGGPEIENSTVVRFFPGKRYKAPNHLSTWADNAEVSVNFFDVKLTFGEAVNLDKEAKTMEIEQKVTIAMSPEHALALLVILQSQMQNYIERFGDLRPLPKPPEQGQADAKSPEA